MALTHKRELQDFKRGIGLLLERFPVRVVPTAIHGAHEAYAPGRILPRPRRVTVAFGSSVDPGVLNSEGDGEVVEGRITDALRRHTADLYNRTRSLRIASVQGE